MWVHKKSINLQQIWEERVELSKWSIVGVSPVIDGAFFVLVYDHNGIEKLYRILYESVDSLCWWSIHFLLRTIGYLAHHICIIIIIILVKLYIVLDFCFSNFYFYFSFVTKNS